MKSILFALAMMGFIAGCESDERREAAPPNDSAEHGAAAASKPASDAYPLDVCVVSGEKLGSMGEPIVIQYKGREVRLCCEGCVEEFEADPAKYMAKLDAAASAPKGPADKDVAKAEHSEHM